MSARFQTFRRPDAAPTLPSSSPPPSLPFSPPMPLGLEEQGVGSVPRMRAISPLVATAILLAATIAVGYLIYNYVGASAGAVAKKPQLMITASASYVGSTAYVEISIKNVGGAAANVTKVTIDGTDVSTQLGIGASGYLLRPGQELHKVVTVSLASGEHVIIVTLSDGSQFKATFIS